jgi:hypothetical protein
MYQLSYLNKKLPKLVIREYISVQKPNDMFLKTQGRFFQLLHLYFKLLWKLSIMHKEYSS